MYLTARGWGMSPDQFWSMTLVEFLTEAMHRNYHRNDPALAGSLSRADLDDLQELLNE